MNEIKELYGRNYMVIQPAAADTKTPWPLILLHGDASMTALLEREQLLPLERCLIVIPISENRLDDFSPWPAPALKSRFPDFGGKADDYLSWISTVLLPHIQHTYPVSTAPCNTGVLGQSLGGLAALYGQTALPERIFGHVAAISPSCWYPGFLPYMEHTIALQGESHTRWYISCGTEEGKGHSDIKSHGVLMTRRMMELLTGHYGNDHVTTRWDDGGHHDYLPLRYRQALAWLAEGTESGSGWGKDCGGRTIMNL